jgi:hypothetical protein
MVTRGYHGSAAVIIVKPREIHEAMAGRGDGSGPWVFMVQPRL